MRWANIWGKDQDHAQCSLLRCYMTNTPSSSTQITTPTADSAVSVTESHPSREKRPDNDQLRSEESPFNITVCKTKKMRDPIAMSFRGYYNLAVEPLIAQISRSVFSRNQPCSIWWILSSWFRRIGSPTSLATWPKQGEQPKGYRETLTRFRRGGTQPPGALGSGKFGQNISALRSLRNTCVLGTAP